MHFWSPNKKATGGGGKKEGEEEKEEERKEKIKPRYGCLPLVWSL